MLKSIITLLEDGVKQVNNLNVSVVLFRNEKEQIQNLINDLLAADHDFIQKIYLIDNSETSKLSTLAEINPKIIYIHCPENLGYGAAHNIGINCSITDRVDYHLVVNPDIRIKPDVFVELISYSNKNLDIGLIMPNIVYPDYSRQHLCKLLPTPLSLFSRRFLPKFISKRFDRKYNLLDIDYSQIMNVPLLSGCFMFLRVATLAKVGGFDPRFFMYLEDFDLVRRIHAKYKTIFYPKVEVIHEFAKGSYKNHKLMIYHIKSAIAYFNKYGWLFDSERRQINKQFLKNIEK